MQQVFLLQTAAAFLLQNASIYYKTREVLQNTLILLQNKAGITKCIDITKWGIIVYK